MLLAPPANHPENYFQLLSRSFNLYTHAFWRTYILALFFSLLLYLPRIISLAYGFQVVQFLRFSLLHPYSPLFIAVYFGSLWFFAAIYWRLHCVAINRHESLMEDFKAAGKKLLYLFGAGIILSLIGFLFIAGIGFCYFILKDFNVIQQSWGMEAIAFFVLFIPCFLAFYVLTLFIFYFPLIVIENDRLFLALRQSVSLAWGKVWKIISFQLTPWIFWTITLVIIELIFHLVRLVFPALHHIVMMGLLEAVHFITFSIFISWSVAAMIVQLRDLELRKVEAG